MPRKKVTFIKTGKEIKEGKFKGFKKVKKSKTMSEKRALKKQAKGQGFIEPITSAPAGAAAYGASMKSSSLEMSLKNNKDIKYAGDVADETAQKSAMTMKAPKGGSWMSKHSKSAFHMGHSPAEMKYKK